MTGRQRQPQSQRGVERFTDRRIAALKFVADGERRRIDGRRRDFAQRRGELLMQGGAVGGETGPDDVSDERSPAAVI